MQKPDQLTPYNRYEGQPGCFTPNIKHEIVKCRIPNAASDLAKPQINIDFLVSFT